MPYKFDGFVSYAHVDDEPLVGAEKGWVTTLINNLNVELARKLGRKDLSLWTDHQLAGNAPLTPTIIQTIRDSAALIVILSPGYLASDWCRREREAFLALIRERTQAGSSVFLVELDFVDRKEYPAELADLRGYRFWVQEKESRHTRTLGTPVPRPEEQSYYDRLSELSYDLAAEIKKQRANPDSTHSAGVNANGPIVFLAEVTDDLENQHQEVKQYLLQANFQVLPKTWYPRDAPEAFQQAVERDLAEARLFIQLLSGVAGRKAPGLAKSYAQLQYECARAAGIPILQWRSRELDLNAVTDPDHQALLEQTTVRACGIEEFKKTIVEEANRKSSPSPPLDSFVFINTDAEDWQLANELSLFFSKHGIWSELPLRQGNPAEIRKDLEDSLHDCDGLIVVYGQTSVNWVRSQFRQGRKILGLRDKPPFCLALFEAPPAPKEELGLRPPNMLTINCQGGLNEPALLGFIEQLKGGR